MRSDLGCVGNQVCCNMLADSARGQMNGEIGCVVVKETKQKVEDEARGNQIRRNRRDGEEGSSASSRYALTHSLTLSRGTVY